ncbi:28 kDa ribonucleoprotein, chloroplastic [Arachis duranensis]|uniref:28 kDa ribonucleoprotein, chloroplastic n=2 Tax=Arachis TaxID=3817 RepID=A0A6P4D906_ARADU|nr:28 kDa ribonucleoprotein, chloroplastic [Arachis duranensis]XP_025651182.1 28 kDa ribonucleoprotein, chloroplastic-like [Arachis hypogaea]XP_025697839.1 28 kDa ribonucleoprotein, chloroplastic-like [Arachis hypogaea]QHO44466.1 RNA-binding protein [Arachis hypogaea]
MAATLESALSIFASHSHRFSNNNTRLSPNLSSLSFSFNASTPRSFSFLCSTLQEAQPHTPTTQEQPKNVKKKLYVFNLPWSMSVADIKDLFSQCGTVTDVEIIKNKQGKSRGFAFVTMASGEEALAVVHKFNSHQISGREIRIELAKRFKKPPPPPPPSPSPPAGETRHVVYVANLAWKVRSPVLRQFFTDNFKTPVSSRVVFESPAGRSAGYGFVSFLTKEDAEAAISALDGKELMERPLRLKLSEKKVKAAPTERDEDQAPELVDQEKLKEAETEKEEIHDSDAQLEQS